MRKTAFRALLGGFASCCLASCSSGEQAENNAEVEPSALADATDVAEQSSAVAGSNFEAVNTGETEVVAPSPTVASTSGNLTAYVGKFPFDAINGVTWRDHPMVISGIRKTVTDQAVLHAMESPGGPSAPIATYQGKVGSWGCEQHNCGDHQWAVLVDPASGDTDVCYHNVEQTGDDSRWYLSDGRQESRSGNCSVV